MKLHAFLFAALVLTGLASCSDPMEEVIGVYEDEFEYSTLTLAQDGTWKMSVVDEDGEDGGTFRADRSKVELEGEGSNVSLTRAGKHLIMHSPKFGQIRFLKQ